MVGEREDSMTDEKGSKTDGAVAFGFRLAAGFFLFNGLLAIPAGIWLAKGAHEDNLVTTGLWTLGVAVALVAGALAKPDAKDTAPPQGTP